MEGVRINLDRNSYNIVINDGLLDRLDEYIICSEIAVITDDIVDSLYFKRLKNSLGDRIKLKYVIPAGEGSKTLAMAEEILSYFSENRLSRQATIISFGGGVVGDLAGFCSSIYMRGVDYYQIPTTLLSQVDSSVGGKTGVNLPTGKNLIGTFYQPKGVFIDTGLLKTLNSALIRSGMGEVIKYGIIKDYGFFKFIEENLPSIIKLDSEAIIHAIKTSCEIKASIVALDEREAGLRKILNHGHTIGHSLEALTKYKEFTHGEAVLIGIFYETKIAEALALITKDYANEIYQLIINTGIETKLTIDKNEILQLMLNDKKNRDGKISFILPNGRGKVGEYLISPEDLIGMLEGL